MLAEKQISVLRIKPSHAKGSFTGNHLKISENAEETSNVAIKKRTVRRRNSVFLKKYSENKNVARPAIITENPVICRMVLYVKP
jgi:hypothetical protein